MKKKLKLVLPPKPPPTPFWVSCLQFWACVFVILIALLLTAWACS